MAVREDGLLMKDKGQSLHGSRIAIAITIGVLAGCVCAFLYPRGFFTPDPPIQSRRVTKSILQIASTSCESAERINMLKSEIRGLSEKNAKLKKQVRELTENLRLAEQGKDHAQKQFMVLGLQHKAGPFGTVKGLRTNPTVIPDEPSEPEIGKNLGRSCYSERAYCCSCEFKCERHVRDFCKSNDVPVYKRDPDEGIDSVAMTGGNHAVSGLKFRILREFLQLGYSVLLSDVDIVYLQNPFDHLYRDSDVESMTDGHNNMTAYGYNDVFDEPAMDPTIPSIELLDRVADRLSRQPNSWDQAVFNEELFFPSHPGYDGLHAAKRTMDFYLFMNSKVLFKTLRKDAKLKKFKPVIVHVNYHPDKFPRMKAIIEFYVNGKQDALEPFPDGSDW
ncbi:hypothetical protein F0562_027264 [Nyssa sinensis]|uniref:Nucleotide-diphospho-sugar transferase domain-containing protein n=1 Tax=Nyssa sinensis TaxID=561372 RepID=A0A5J5B5V9_9ASTE|nr:hypothetical protein F0562_027264 [Nyssa sinensis]